MFLMLNSSSGLKFSSDWHNFPVRGLLSLYYSLCRFFFSREASSTDAPTFTVYVCLSVFVCVCVFHPKGVRSLNNVRVVIDYNH